ncbi:MAG: hypothetical protein ACXW48_18370 [Candidatus Binatia bacterium]
MAGESFAQLLEMNLLNNHFFLILKAANNHPNAAFLASQKAAVRSLLAAALFKKETPGE